MEPEVTLICMRADAPWMTRGSSFRRCCSKCSERVMVAPSGELELERSPNAVIVCHKCFLAQPIDPKAEYRGPTQAQMMEMRNAMPNFWRGRN